MSRPRWRKEHRGALPSPDQQPDHIRKHLIPEADPNGNRKAKRLHKRNHGGFKKDQPSEVDSE